MSMRNFHVPGPNLRLGEFFKIKKGRFLQVFGQNPCLQKNSDFFFSKILARGGFSGVPDLVLKFQEDCRAVTRENGT